MKKHLSKMEAALYGTLASSPDCDVPIKTLFEAVRPGLELPVRTMQQRLGSAITRVNAKLETGRVVPGRIKQTYRLQTKAP